MKKSKYVSGFFFLFFFIVSLMPGKIWADKQVTVLVLPFKINSERNRDYLKDGIYDMISTRLAQSGNAISLGRQDVKLALKGLVESVSEANAANIGKKVSADYVIFGSLTVLGKSISTDARFFDVHTGKSVVTFHESGKSTEDIIPHIDNFTARINETVVNVKPAVLPVLPKKKKDVPLKKTPARIPGQVTGDKTAGSFWKSEYIKGRIVGLCAGDVDADGKNETVFITKKIHVRRHVDGKFMSVEDIGVKKSLTLIGVDIADINGNGIPEIFVTAVVRERATVLSFVLEWNGTVFKRIVKKSRWYFRVLDVPGRGDVLLGQARGMKDVFSSGVYELKWENGKYVSGLRLDLPKHINVFGVSMGDVLNNGKESIMAFAKNDHIRILDREGNEEWVSNEAYGGSKNYLEYVPEGSSSMSGEQEKNRIFLPQRIHIGDIDNDGKNDILAIRNLDSAKRIFARFRSFKSGAVECLSWKNQMTQKWKTRKFPGYISDFDYMDFDNDGKDELVLSVVSKTKSVIGKTKSFIVSHDPDQP